MLSPYYNIILASLTSFFVVFFAIPKVIFFAQKFRLADVAGKRASHKGSVPVFGGIAIYSGIIFSLLFWTELANVQFIIVALLVVFFLGVIDDLLSLSPRKKIIGQIISVLIVIYFGDIQINNMHGVLGIYVLPDIIATLFTGFVFVVITNSFNLIDGVDGLACGIGIISSFCFGVTTLLMDQIDMAIISFSLMGALIAFLKYNAHPARIFMGDTGSLVVGFILSVLAINIISEGIIIKGMPSFPNKGPLLAIAFLAIPLFDSLRVFIVRVSLGRNPLSPGRGHIHHALLDLGFGHIRTTMTLILVSIILIIVSYFLLELNINISIAILAFVSYVLLIIPFYILRKSRK